MRTILFSRRPKDAPRANSEERRPLFGGPGIFRRGVTRWPFPDVDAPTF
jgi:hypothetical protein